MLSYPRVEDIAGLVYLYSTTDITYQEVNSVRPYLCGGFEPSEVLLLLPSFFATLLESFSTPVDTLCSLSPDSRGAELATACFCEPFSLSSCFRGGCPVSLASTRLRFASFFASFQALCRFGLISVLSAFWYRRWFLSSESLGQRRSLRLTSVETVDFDDFKLDFPASGFACGNELDLLAARISSSICIEISRGSIT